MKFFATSQVQVLDQYTIEHEPIASIDLMERAADALSGAYQHVFGVAQPVCIVAGQGNNGGDALALARKLLQSGYDVSAWLINSDRLSPDCQTNLKGLTDAFPEAITELKGTFVAPPVTPGTVIVDGLFGSGLSRPLSGVYAEMVRWMNKSGCQVVSIDIPSGLQGEENKLTKKSVIVKATLTLSLQFPKLAFFFSENDVYVGSLHICDIGIHPQAIASTASDYYYTQENDVAGMLKVRSKFSHKGTFGHVLVVAGSKGMAGASVLSSKAALRSGAGLVTVRGPECNRVIVQSSVSEVIFQSDKNSELVSEVIDIDRYSAIAAGPGIGIHIETADMLRSLLTEMNKPCILDADALNLISQQKDLLPLIPKNSILTPHPKEFERLFGACANGYERMLKAKKYAMQHELIIVLKGAYTLIVTPDGGLYFNSTGNCGLATAGSGDVLTGVLVSLLAQGYSPEDTARLGVYLHGRAGDLALKAQSEESLIATDVIHNLGKAFKSLRESVTKQ